MLFIGHQRRFFRFKRLSFRQSKALCKHLFHRGGVARTDEHNLYARGFDKAPPCGGKLFAGYLFRFLCITVAAYAEGFALKFHFNSPVDSVCTLVIKVAVYGIYKILFLKLKVFFGKKSVFIKVRVKNNIRKKLCPLFHHFFPVYCKFVVCELKQ